MSIREYELGDIYGLVFETPPTPTPPTLQDILRGLGGGPGTTTTPAPPLDWEIDPETGEFGPVPRRVTAPGTAPGTTGAGEDVNRDLVRDVARQGSTDISTTRDIQRNEEVTRTGQTAITGTERRYIDIPTPEEFLDDFRTGFSTYIKNLGGAIPHNAGLWLAENMEMFLDSYLGTLGQMAQRGEQVFRATAVSPEVTPLGQRPGEVSDVTARGRTETETVGGMTSDQTSRERGTTGTGTTEGPAAPAPVAAVAAPGTSPGAAAGEGTESLLQTTTTDETTRQRLAETSREKQGVTSDQRTTTGMTEDVFARPKIGVVRTLSPLDFMAKQWSPSSLLLRYEGFRASRAARARVGEGGLSARRVV